MRGHEPVVVHQVTGDVPVGDEGQRVLTESAGVGPEALRVTIHQWDGASGDRTAGRPVAGRPGPAVSWAGGLGADPGSGVLVVLPTMTTSSLADAQAHLSKLVARVSGQHERVYVTVHGKPSAVLLATDAGR